MNDDNRATTHGADAAYPHRQSNPPSMNTTFQGGYPPYGGYPSPFDAGGWNRAFQAVLKTNLGPIAGIATVGIAAGLMIMRIVGYILMPVLLYEVDSFQGFVWALLSGINALIIGFILTGIVYQGLWLAIVGVLSRSTRTHPGFPGSNQVLFPLMRSHRPASLAQAAGLCCVMSLGVLLVGLAVIASSVPLAGSETLVNVQVALANVLLIAIFIAVIFLSVRLSPAPVFAVIDGCNPSEALRRSWTITRGQETRIVGNTVRSFLPLVPITIGVTIVLFPLGISLGRIFMILPFIFVINWGLVVPVQAIASYLMYFDLHVRRGIPLPPHWGPYGFVPSNPVPTQRLQFAGLYPYREAPSPTRWDAARSDGSMTGTDPTTW